MLQRDANFGLGHKGGMRKVWSGFPQNASDKTVEPRF